MKHSGQARKAAFKLIVLSLVAVVVVWAIGFLVTVMGISLMAILVVIAPMLVVVWVLFAAFTVFFFRDPTPRVPAGANLVLSPAHAKVDVIDRTTEPEFMGGECQRVACSGAECAPPPEIGEPRAGLGFSAG